MHECVNGCVNGCVGVVCLGEWMDVWMISVSASKWRYEQS